MVTNTKTLTLFILILCSMVSIQAKGVNDQLPTGNYEVLKDTIVQFTQTVKTQWNNLEKNHPIAVPRILYGTMALAGMLIIKKSASLRNMIVDQSRPPSMDKSLKQKLIGSLNRNLRKFIIANGGIAIGYALHGIRNTF